MNPGGDFALACRVGDEFRVLEERGRGGWARAKALILVVARNGDWNGAEALAQAFSLGPDAIEEIYREVYGEFPVQHSITLTLPAGGATPVQPPRSQIA
jgi:hypothetical protein